MRTHILAASACAILVILASAFAAPAAEQPAPNVWPTAVPEAPAPPAECGNALLERGESCDTCPQDCEPRDCKSKGRHAFQIRALPPIEAEPIAATLQISYRTDRLKLPGEKQEKSVLERIDFGADPGITAANDLGYSLRLVRSEGTGLKNPVAVITFDGCKGAPEPTAEDLVCVVEGCAGAGGAITGCTCVVVAAPTR